MERKFKELLADKARLIACLMAVLSFLMIFFPWIEAKGETKETLYELKVAMNTTRSFLFEVTRSDVISEVTDEWGLDYEKAEKLINYIIDGKLTLSESILVSQAANKILNAMTADMSYDEIAEGAASELHALNTALTLYRILVYAVAVVALLCVVLRFQEKSKMADIVLLILNFVVLVALFYITDQCKYSENAIITINIALTPVSILAVLVALPPRIYLKYFNFAKPTAVGTIGTSVVDERTYGYDAQTINNIPIASDYNASPRQTEYTRPAEEAHYVEPDPKPQIRSTFSEAASSNNISEDESKATFFNSAGDL